MATKVERGRLVGQPVRRREDERILRGQAHYLDDVELPRLAHVAFVRSPHAYARIRGIRKPEGALLVLTAADLDGRAGPLPVMPAPGADVAPAPHPVLAGEEARYVGQAVAAVVAETRALAEDLAERVEVDYEPLEPALDPRTAPERLLSLELGGGDVDGAFAAADRVVSGSFRIPRLVAAPMETRGAVAEYDPGSGVLTVWVSAQDPHRQRAGLSYVLGLPDDRIHVIVPDVGGAFGSKGVVAPETCATAVAATILGRPVKWVEDRLENFLASYQGRGMEADVELALQDDGGMLGLRARIFTDLGGYLFPSTPVSSWTTAALMSGCYTLPAAKVEVTGARTNKVPTGPYRGAGRPEAALLVEGIVALAARELGIDPVELRRRNLIAADAFPYDSPLGFRYDSGDFERCLDEAIALAETPEPRDGWVTGTGIALYVERAGGQWESAEVTIEPSGRVVVASGSSPHGQGHDTTFMQIVVDELGIEPEDVVLRFGDSAVVPRGVGTFASRSVAMGGSALLQALEPLKERCRAVAAHLLDADPDDVAWEGGHFSVGDGRMLSFRELAAAAYTPGRVPELGLSATGRFSSPQVFSSGAYVATVEIERATGRLRVRQIVAVDDAGTIVNPLLAEGQVYGGVVQALGECLSEEMVYDESGQPRTASLADYSLPTAVEVPPIRAAFVETPSPFNPLGAKGIGEGGTIGALPAVANAVLDAVGRWVDPPFTEDKLWKALNEEEA